ncbi:MAG TPA: sodium:solute symporter family protein [Bacteroidota bacterium]|nr:sodium:solute symporter family protein [Bacteroidota bacterium]
MIHLSPVDIGIIMLYFGGVLFVGYRSTRRTGTSEEDFLLAGRSLTLPIFVMTLVSTWYGGILGVGEFSYRYGISNWVVQGVPYYFFAALFAFTLAKKIRGTNLFTIPDMLEAAYDKKTAILGSILTFVLMTPAPYILMLSVFLQMLFGWNLLLSLGVTAVVAVSYLYAGGFRADVETDVLEFILMFAGFAVIIPYCFLHYGGFAFLDSRLPALHLTATGGNSIQYVVVWFFIALWTLVDPAFHQRCYAAKSGTVAQKGILISIIFWFLFDFMTATAGLYARAAIPNLREPMMAYPALAEEILPPVAKGMFYVGMLATIMSTLNTLAFVSAQTLGRDILLRLGVRSRAAGNSAGPAPLEAHWGSGKSTRYTQLGLILAFMLSVIIALAIPSVIRIWYTIGTVIIPGLLVPLMASYFDSLRIPARFAFSAMAAGWLISTGWLIWGTLVGDGGYPLGIEPMYPGLFASLAIWAAGRASIAARG